MRRRVRFPAWYLLLLAVLEILSRCQSPRDLERIARRHHGVLTEALGLELRRPPSDSSFRRSALPFRNRTYSYVNRDFYRRQLGEIWRFFASDQVLILRQMCFAQSAISTLADIQQFFGLASFLFMGEIHTRQLAYKAPMPRAARDLFRRIFCHEICQLQALLGWDCTDWLEVE